MPQIVNVTMENFFKFLYCPVQYDLFKKGIIKNVRNNHKQALEKIARFFMTNLMSGNVVPMKDLTKRWDSFCRKNIDTITPKESIEGIARIATMYKWAERIKLRIMDMIIPFEISFAMADQRVINIIGNIPVIALNQGGEPELIALDFGSKQTVQSRLDMDLKLTIYCYAYRQKTGFNLGIRSHNLKYDTDSFSYRHKGDYDRLEKAAVNVGTSIVNNIIYPRESVMCASCPTMGACKLWC